MKLIQKSKTILIGSCTVISTIIGQFTDKTEITNLILPDSKPDDVQFIIVLVYFIAGALGSILFTYLYDSVLWRLFHPQLNFRGYWYYENVYSLKNIDSTTEPTKGYVRIEQSPSEISMSDGINSKTNKHKSTFKSVSMSFVDNSSLVSYYNVFRSINGTEYCRRAVEELRVRKRNSFGIPIILETHFSVVHEPDSSISKVWPEKSGTATYYKISKEEYENRELAEKSRNLLYADSEVKSTSI